MMNQISKIKHQRLTFDGKFTLEANQECFQIIVKALRPVPPIRGLEKGI